MNANYLLGRIFTIGHLMRQHQKDYFRTRSLSELEKSKKYEKLFDKLLAQINQLKKDKAIEE